MKISQPQLSSSSTCVSLISATQSLASSHSATSSRPKVLLATAQALLVSPTHISHPVRLLIDPGSELTLVSHQLTRQLRLKLTNSYVPIVGVGSVSSGHTQGVIDLTLRSRHSAEHVNLHAHVLANLTVELPVSDIKQQTWPHINVLQLADPDYLSSGRIDILIGADAYGLIIKPGVKAGNSNQPVAIQTIFGWAVIGPVGESSHSAPSYLGHLVSNAQLHELVANFWELEEVPSSQHDYLSAEEAACEAHFISTHTRDSSGRYIVRLPFKENASKLGNSKVIAQKAITRLRKRLDDQPELNIPLSKWKSNHRDFIKLNSTSTPSAESHEFNESMSKILGLAWHCSTDSLKFTGHAHCQVTITKRSILSETAQLFDPLGLISPVIVRAKILMQDLWLEKVGWDDTLSPQIIHRWSAFREELSRLSQLSIPRWLNLCADGSQVELHGFSDASQAAMAAAVYLKTSHSCTSSKVTLVCSKTRVAPLKRLTIPRLELSAALLLAKLVSKVQKVLKLTEAPVTLWTDSSVSLAWINSDPMRWKEFVKNRVQEIQQTSPQATWKFISGKHNPADCASRGLTPSQLISHSLWWSGPDWLAEDVNLWPSFIIADDHSPEAEIRPSAVNVSSTASQLPFESLLKHSSLTKLLRRTATLMRAVAVFKRVPASSLRAFPLTPAGLQSALRFWIRAFQNAYFASEIRAISQGESLAKSHPLSRLTARVDTAGVLRVGGRLQNSKLVEDAKHPPILPKDCILSNLIIANAHTRTLHGGTQLTLNYIRKYCWILGGRAPIKSYIHRCITCTRIRGIRAQQQMGQLPATRVTPSLVFEHSGVDYAGPVSLKFFQGRGTKTYKAWIAIFVCFSTSATHLEVVTDYSAQGFLKAFRRFTARRGICKTLTSDCGTNFQGADVALKQLLSGSIKESQHLQQLITNDGTQWRFNPPGAPHMGGKWEAAVKSVKYHLQRTIADLLLTYEDFSTFLAQVEAVLNSRPLSALTEDPDDLSALTPGHFIRGAPLSTIPEPSLTSVNANRLSHFQRIQERLQHFWARWSADCLQSHQTISKWRTSYNNIVVGSLVLLTDERYPPSKWPLARVTRVHPGRDGLTRVVTLKTATSSFTRPITKLVLLPIASQEGDPHDDEASTS